jgi:hypothetical protein
MTSAKKEVASEELNFNNLTDSSKRRKTLGLCRDAGKRHLAGYDSAIECTASVMGGNYGIAFSVARNAGGAKRILKSATSK